MFFIIALLWISISSPVWIIGTLLYLIIMSLFHFFKITLIIILATINLFRGQENEYVIFNIKNNIINSIVDLFSRYNDLFYNFWDFGIDHPYWSLFCSAILIFIYYLWPSD